MLCGGAEKVVYILFQMLEKKSIESRLVVLGGIDLKQFPLLDSDRVLQYQNENVGGKIKNNIDKVLFIRKKVQKEKPSAVLSFIDTTNILTILSTLFLSVPVFISERNNPLRSTMSPPWYVLRKAVYRYSKALIVANSGMKKKCMEAFKTKKIIIIPNLMRLNDLERKGGRRLIAVGSLTAQKRFDLLIESIRILANRNSLCGFTLDIYGKGPLYGDLYKLIKQKGLSEIISLKGQTDDIWREYASSDIFVLSSDYEGQPNVLLEAMSMGLSCISTRCDFGPAELITHGKDGLLVDVNDPWDLALSIEKLIRDEKLRDFIGEHARLKIKAEFSEEKVLQTWSSLFMRV